MPSAPRVRNVLSVKPSLACISALSLLAGCYASHERPEERPVETPDAGEPDAGPPSEPGTCREACASPADCGGGPLRTCMDGACYFVGCGSDRDCAAGSGCALELRQCRPRCEATSDCAELGTDGGEVACLDGLCRLVGCPSDAWCADYAARWELEGRYGCTSRPAGARPRCWRVCDTDADCATRAGDHPRACVSGVCRLVDCTASAQCRSWHADDWLCVRP